jgi:hypothetical protein
VCTNRFDLVTLTFMFDLFDLLFKNFNIGMVVNGICLYRGHLCFTNTFCFISKQYFSTSEDNLQNANIFSKSRSFASFVGFI